MSKQVLFIQGGGNDGYDADARLVDSLQQALGVPYSIRYPRLQTDESLPDFGWLRQIGDELEKLSDEGILVAHSLGAALLLRYLSENKLSTKAYGVFLLATPFWTGQEDWVQGLTLQADFAQCLPPASRFFFYHCRDDEEVPFDHLTTYRKKLPTAMFREIDRGGHQFENSLDVVAQDIKGQSN
ncbi:alpha/beta hydrolase [Fibrella sp. WM1]|uniref:alpha/beta hydrolase n=1 Tax=Fibrella musci TaxID=3242485 RepID=UPI003521FF52